MQHWVKNGISFKNCYDEVQNNQNFIVPHRFYVLWSLSLCQNFMHNEILWWTICFWDISITERKNTPWMRFGVHPIPRYKIWYWHIPFRDWLLKELQFLGLSPHYNNSIDIFIKIHKTWFKPGNKYILNSLIRGMEGSGISTQDCALYLLECALLCK